MSKSIVSEAFPLEDIDENAVSDSLNDLNSQLSGETDEVKKGKLFIRSLM